MEQDKQTPGKAELLARRVKEMVLTPSAAWPGVAAEDISLGQLITQVAMPLAAIGPIARLIHTLLFRTGTTFMGSVHFGLGGGLAGALGDFVKQLMALAVAGLAIELLAPRFGGKASRIGAFKLATWSLSAAWATGVFELLPGLGVVGILGALYGIFLVSLGAGPVLGLPEERAANFTLALVGTLAGLWLALHFALIPVLGHYGGGMMGGPGMGGMMR